MLVGFTVWNTTDIHTKASRLGKIERYQRLLADECLYARPYASEAEHREAIVIWKHHYNYHRPHTACGDQPRPHASTPVSTTP